MNEFLEKNLNNVVLGDCLELIKNLDDNSIDVCFTSPPYNSKGNEGMRADKSDSHQKYLSPETWDNWLEFQYQIIDEMLRVTKKYVLYNIQAIKSNRQDVYSLIGHYANRIHDIIIWYKPNGAPTSTPNKISNKYEMILILKPDGVDKVDVNSTYYTNVLTFGLCSNNEYRDIHKAVMNYDLAYEIIKEFTKERECVLDPFFGTGTTGVACKALNRNFIGFEINQTYVDASINRLYGIKRKGSMKTLLNI